MYLFSLSGFIIWDIFRLFQKKKAETTKPRIALLFLSQIGEKIGKVEFSLRQNRKTNETNKQTKQNSTTTNKSLGSYHKQIAHAK